MTTSEATISQVITSQVTKIQVTLILNIICNRSSYCEIKIFTQKSLQQKSYEIVILLALATLGDVTQGVAKPKVAEASTILSYVLLSPTVCEKLSQCTLDFYW